MSLFPFTENVYKSKWVVFAVLMVFTPLGLFLLYKTNKFTFKHKIVIAVIAIILSLSVNNFGYIRDQLIEFRASKLNSSFDETCFEK